ncbi:membrane protein YczE [Pseudolysinimonas sp.]|uniref:membrane protein YczE n=1 Tax=Pseudolysinimonas sp. TaxID=2680009 RepID=UPI003F8076DD
MALSLPIAIPTAGDAPAIRARRIAQLLGGLFLYGIAISLEVRAGIGLSPWDVLAQGLANRTGIPFGFVTNIVGALVLLVWIPLRQRPGIGTVLNVLLVGPSAQLGLWLIPQQHAPMLQGLMFAGGLLLLAVATGLYIGARMGPGPRDGLMTGLRQRFGWSIWVARTIVEGSVLVVGAILGGQVGIGTVAFVLLVGPLVHVAMPLLRVPGGAAETPVVRPRPAAGLASFRPRSGDRDGERVYADLRAVSQRDERVG